MHGITGGMMSELQDGSFASGLASAAASSLVSSGIEGIGETGGTACVNGKDVPIMTEFSKTPGFKALMLASGGLSGGLSSSIAGGNFFDGVRQGLITSGLNHLAHYVANSIEERHTVKGVLKRLGLNPSGQTPKTYASLKLLLSDSAMNSQYFMGGSPTVGDGGQLSIGKEDYYVTNGERAVATTDVFGNGNIVMYGDSFKNWETLGYNLVHELDHRFQFVMGYTSRWLQKYHNDKNVVYNIGEYFAHITVTNWGFNAPAGYISSPRSNVNNIYPNTLK